MPCEVAMQNLSKYLANVLVKAKRAEVKKEFSSAISRSESIRKSIHRIPGKSETSQQEPKPPLYGAIFCSHNKPYFHVCTKCGRDRQIALRNIDIVLRSVGTAPAFFTKK